MTAEGGLEGARIYRNDKIRKYVARDDSEFYKEFLCLIDDLVDGRIWIFIDPFLPGLVPIPPIICVDARPLLQSVRCCREWHCKSGKIS